MNDTEERERALLTERQVQLMKYLQGCEDYTTTGRLAEVFHVSSRSIRNDLDAIQYFLKGMPVEIERTPRLGIKLIIQKGFDITGLYSNNEIKVYSREERIVIITVLLTIFDKMTIEQLAQKLQMSKNTIVQDIRQADDFLSRRGITLVKKSYFGLSLKGDEEQIRNMLFNLYIKTESQGSLNILEVLREHVVIDPEIGKRLIHRMEQAMGLKFVDESIGELESMILASLCRIHHGFHVEDKEAEGELADDPYAQAILQELQDFSLTEGDLRYFAMLFQSTKRMNGELKRESEEDRTIIKATELLIRQFCCYLKIGCRLQSDIRKQIMMHLKVAVFRLKNKIEIQNPLLEDIKYSHSFMYEITERLLKEQEEMLGVVFPESEIAYTTMYFEVLFQENFSLKLSPEILLVCGGGTATAVLLKQRLQECFPELQVRKICRASDVEEEIRKARPDFIISTVPLHLEKQQVIQVNPLLNPPDIDKIKNIISVLVYNRKNSYLVHRLHQTMKRGIRELLKEEYCQFDVETDDWREAIAIATAPLIKDGLVEPSYVDEMVRTVQNLGNYMVFIPEIAFVHGKKDKVRENCISFLRLHHAIDFGSKAKVDVKVVIVLGNVTENENLADLVRILAQGGNMEKIKQINSYQELVSLREDAEEEL